MDVKTVSRTISFGEYENISMMAEVGEAETPGHALKKLEEVIMSEIVNKNKGQNLHYDVQDLTCQRDQLENEIGELQLRKIECGLWLEGINFYEIDLDQSPF